MSDATSDSHPESPATPPVPPPLVFGGKRPKTEPLPATTPRDESHLARTILTYLFYATLAGTASLALFGIHAGGDGHTWDLRIVGGLLLFAFAAMAAGAAVGFLFGIPRTLPRNTPTESASYQVNSNLVEISDWLTKIIVGLGLINLKTIPERVVEMNRYVSETLRFNPPAYAIVGSAAVFFATVGFLLGYLSTRLFVSSAFREADNDLLRTVAKEAEPFAKTGAQQQRDSEPASKPVDVRVKNLVRVAEETEATPSTVTPEVARQLARAYAATEDFDRAVPFFERAGAKRGDDEDLAVDYAYALGESGRRQEAIAFAENLFARKGTLDAARLLGYLFLWFPQHIDHAIGWTRLYLESRPEDSGAYLNLACGYAQRFGLTKNDDDRRRAIESLQKAIKMNSGWRERAQQLRHEDFASLSDEDFRRAINPA